MRFIIAKKDKTYCVNKNCKQKDSCFRYEGHYMFEPEENYSFCEFTQENCVGKEEK